VLGDVPLYYDLIPSTRNPPPAVPPGIPPGAQKYEIIRPPPTPKPKLRHNILDQNDLEGNYLCDNGSNRSNHRIRNDNRRSAEALGAFPNIDQQFMDRSFEDEIISSGYPNQMNHRNIANTG
jgi:hypothetical protein